MSADDSTRTVEYRDIPGFPDYRVGDDGSVWSRKRLNRWRQLSPRPQVRGYYSVLLSKDGIGSDFLIHRLVLLAFVGPCPDGMEACHNNGISGDNRLENLRWDTHRANSADQKIHGTKWGWPGANNPNAKLTEEQAIEVIRLRGVGLTAKAIAKMFNMSTSGVFDIEKGKNWPHLDSYRAGKSTYDA